MAEKKENELQAGKLVVHFLRKYAFFVNRGRDLSALVEMTRERCGRDDKALPYHSGNRSVRSLFMVSIRASFLALDHFLRCFSLAMACSTSENDSKYTSLWHLYFCVKPGIVPDLCSATRLSMSFVTPMYNVVSLLFARMYV